MAISEDPLEEYRQIGGRFTEVVDGVPAAAWNNPTPVAQWQARDVVVHLTTWFRGFLQGSTGLVLAASVDPAEHPVEAWHAQHREVMELLASPTSAELMVSSPQLPAMPLPTVISRFYTADVFLHTWDLARATNQDDTLDPQRCVEMYDGMLPIQEVLRASGHYGPAHPLPEGADAQERLLAFIGRDPHWQAPADQ